MCVCVCGRIPPPIDTGLCPGGAGGGLQVRSPTPYNLVLPLWRGREKGGGGRLKRTGRDLHLTGKGRGPCRLPTGDGSR